MTPNAPAPHPEHSVEELCAAGSALYERALRSGHVRHADADAAPCLVDFGLLQPAINDLDRLEPVSPVVALHQLLRSVADRIADERRREERLASVFEPLIGIGRPRTVADIPTIRAISGVEQINSAITRTMADASMELLAIQPHFSHTDQHPHAHAIALSRDQALLDRGGRIRTLYQHTLRHAPTVIARYEQLRGDAEARTLDEVTDRLILVDRTVAFIPAGNGTKVALEIRHPALVSYLITTFDRLWHLAIPMYPHAVQRPSLDGITPRQRAIAALLVEGHTDAVIATRLGLNVRTARVHIAKLAATLGSESRAQLGYLIGQSGILDHEQEMQQEQKPDQDQTQSSALED